MARSFLIGKKNTPPPCGEIVMNRAGGVSLNAGWGLSTKAKSFYTTLGRQALGRQAGGRAGGGGPADTGLVLLDVAVTGAKRRQSNPFCNPLRRLVHPPWGKNIRDKQLRTPYGGGGGDSCIIQQQVTLLLPP